MSSKTNALNERLLERLLECQDKLEGYEGELGTWTDSLEELSVIVNAFKLDKRNKLHGNTILDIGTDCVKPLYIALKFEPDKIIGIDEDLSYTYASDIEQKSKLLTKTGIHFYDCSLFDRKMLNKILKNEKEDKFDFVLVSKTLHHLRTGECIVKDHDQKHKCREDEKCCIYKFKEQKIFKRLLELGKRVIVYEWFCPYDEDDDKVRGRGGYFTIKEWRRIFANLSENYRVELIDPLKCHLGKKELEKVIVKLRQVDSICFYVETR